MDADVTYIGHVTSGVNGESIYQLVRTYKNSEITMEYGCVPATCHIQFGRKPNLTSPSKRQAMN